MNKCCLGKVYSLDLSSNASRKPVASAGKEVNDLPGLVLPVPIGIGRRYTLHFTLFISFLMRDLNGGKISVEITNLCAVDHW